VLKTTLCESPHSSSSGTTSDCEAASTLWQFLEEKQGRVEELDRRRFLRLIAGAASSSMIGGLAGCGATQGINSTSQGNSQSNPASQALTSAARSSQSSVDKIVVVMMENRSFDHLLGWLPGADGRQAGLTYPDQNGQLQPTWHLQGIYRGCDLCDPNHSYEGGRQEYNGGALNGFLTAQGNDKFAIGYYEEPDLPFHAALARHFTSCDRYFASILAATIPNRIFLHAGQTDNIVEPEGNCSLPTIWDSLALAGVHARYYYSNYSYLSLWGSKYDAISGPTADFFTDAINGTLPAVSFVEPSFSLQDSRQDGQDQHPNADIRRGETFLWNVYQAVTSGPAWKQTVLIITYDEWGGFFDHVLPPRVIAPNDADADLIDGRALLGFRLPVTVVSPFSRGNSEVPRVSSTLFDHTSILKLIEWRWGLAPLTARDASTEIGNLATALDLTAEPADAPELAAPPPAPAPIACSAQPTL
jgi:phospholipase C